MVRLREPPLYPSFTHFQLLILGRLGAGDHNAVGRLALIRCRTSQADVSCCGFDTVGDSTNLALYSRVVETGRIDEQSEVLPEISCISSMDGTRCRRRRRHFSRCEIQILSDESLSERRGLLLECLWVDCT